MINYIVDSPLISSAKQYIAQLNWWLVPVNASDPNPKKPIFSGWTELQLNEELLDEIYEKVPSMGIGLHLGASGMIDVEADEEESDKLLWGLVGDLQHPCWRSRRGSHHLF